MSSFCLIKRANVHSRLLPEVQAEKFFMRRVNAQRQSDRRAEILDAAQRCFVRSGFHGASMQDICAEAGMSPGNLYRYFPSKEALIAGIAERDRAEVAQEFARADLSQGFFKILEGMAQHHFAQRPDHQVAMCTEIMAEARRNPEIARICATFDADVHKRLVDLMRAAAGHGDITDDVDFDAVASMLMIIADGVWWRRALDRNFEPAAVVPVFMDITRHMLRRRLKTVADSDQTNVDGSGTSADRQFRRAAGTAFVPDDLGGS
jgi:AcrR family transcriptional regulator